MKKVPPPSKIVDEPTPHLSTEFHFDNGWSVEYIKRLGSGYQCLITYRTVKNGVVEEQLCELPASKENKPAVKHARRLAYRVYNQVRNQDVK